MKKTIKYGSALTALALATSAGTAGPFLPGSLVVVRVGDGSAALTSPSTAAFLEERAPTDGSLIQVIPLPTAAAGAQGALTLSGTATSEGFLTITTDGNFLF